MQGKPKLRTVFLLAVYKHINRGKRIPYGRGDKVDGDIDLAGTEEVEVRWLASSKSQHLLITMGAVG